MTAAIITILKLVSCTITGGLVFRNLRNAHQSTWMGKVAAIIVFLISVAFLIPDFMGKSIETEKDFWTSIEKHPSEEMYLKYLEKYPEGEFKEIAETLLKQTEARRATEQAEADKQRQPLAIEQEQLPANDVNSIIVPKQPQSQPPPRYTSPEPYQNQRPWYMSQAWWDQHHNTERPYGYNPQTDEKFLRDYQEYVTKTEKKALALAVSSNGKSIWASSFDDTTQEQAIDEALSTCRKVVSQYRIYADCKLYAIGDEVVW